MKIKNNKGFSLIELLVVIAIIAVLVTIGINSFMKVQRDSRDAKRQSDLKVIQSALEQYRSDQNYYPETVDLNLAIANSLTSPDDNPKIYLAKIPKDSQGFTGYFYQAAADGCDNTTGNYCTSYSLCAKVENSTNANATVNCDSTTYNYEVEAP